MTASVVSPDGEELTLGTSESEGMRPLKRLDVMRPGFDSVAHMLATPGFTWAHRGSGNGGRWPEMTLLAYSQAVRLGYGVLEVSMNRSSDGVWFGLHDTHLDRVALGTNTTTLQPTAMTWSEISSYQVTQPGRQKNPQPFMRIEELLEAYGDSHIFVLDPKYRRNDRLSEFLDLCEDIGPDRCIIKADLNFPKAINDAKARNHRFKGWGYFWESGNPALNEDPLFDSWVSQWDLVGCEWQDSQGIFDRIENLGKPVVAHIVQSQSQYNTAIAKGAIGVQCGATHEITPVSRNG